jgi:hypothetical protein
LSGTLASLGPSVPTAFGVASAVTLDGGYPGGQAIGIFLASGNMTCADVTDPVLLSYYPGVPATVVNVGAYNHSEPVLPGTYSIPAPGASIPSNATVGIGSVQSAASGGVNGMFSTGSITFSEITGTKIVGSYRVGSGFPDEGVSVAGSFDVPLCVQGAKDGG